ncbi:hypothetical protein EZY14_005945 [Kordia sp. TARA_039_SRF]|nr:hypothetical protein EZY14_005945 [Kordia sp. TARA_039_SRF]
MTRIILILLLLPFLVGCSSSDPTASSKTVKVEGLTKREAFEKYSDGFSIQKLPNWEFHSFHGMLNYTPKRLMEVGREYIYNGVTVTKQKIKDEVLADIVNDYIYERKKSEFDEITVLKKVKEPTKYGESIVLIYTNKINYTEFKAIKQFYVYNGILYKVAYTAKSIFFDFFVNDAIHMMKTFTITEE